jgi:hypothetical protein
MNLTFSERSNSAIKKLVDLCYPTPLSPAELLLTEPLDDLLYRSSTPNNDERIDVEDEQAITLSASIKAHQFTSSKRIISDFIVAVDSGVVNLGQLMGGGVAFAIRGAATCYSGKNILVLRYNTGALLLTPQNKLAIFRYVGERLGKPDLYVMQNAAGKLVPRPAAIDNANQMQDRCRNFVERMIQEEAIGVLAANNGGILLVDGALAVSYDTPKGYLQKMLEYARYKAIDVCAISKRSSIAMGGIPIDMLFDSYPTFVGYAPLMEVMEVERHAYEQQNMRAPEDITAGTEVFAARFGFGPPGITFRVDTSKSWGSTDVDIINDVYNKCQIYGGYPKPLIDAHQYSSFLGGEAVNLLADLVVRTNLRVKEQQSLGVLFEPFGSFGK